MRDFLPVHRNLQLMFVLVVLIKVVCLLTRTDIIRAKSALDQRSSRSKSLALSLQNNTSKFEIGTTTYTFGIASSLTVGP